MCLTKRIPPCEICYHKQVAEQALDKIEEKMEQGLMTDGDYLEDMNVCKQLYDAMAKRHKQKGCTDLLLDDDDANWPSETEVERIAVAEFYWNDELYYRDEDNNLYNPTEHYLVGEVRNRIVTIF